MFGLGGQKSKVRHHRKEFEDIRQRVMFRYNSFEQYSFGTAFMALSDEVQNLFEGGQTLTDREWTKLAIQLDMAASRAYRQYSKISGIAGEGGRAGAEGLKLFALEAGARSFPIPEAALLQADIKTFRLFVSDFVTAEDYRSERLPV